MISAICRGPASLHIGHFGFNRLLPNLRQRMCLPGMLRMEFLQEKSIRDFSSNKTPKKGIQPLQKYISGKEKVESSYLSKKPDYTPISPLTKMEVGKIASSEVGSMNLNLNERDIIELDALAQQFTEMLHQPFAEDCFKELADYDVSAAFNKMKDTLRVEDVPKAVKAMRVLSAQNRVEDAKFVWSLLQKTPSQCSLYAWTAYFSVLCSNRETDKALQVLKDMLLSGVKPDTYIYSILVNGLVKEDRLDQAFQITREMTHTGEKPNNVIVSSLLWGCIRNHQLQRAEETFNLMRNYIEEADPITTSLMIRVAEMRHNTEEAMFLFSSIEGKGQTMTQGCYHAVMHACCRSWRYDVMTWDYFTAMKDAGFVPTRESFHLLLKAAGVHGDFVRAQETLQEMQMAGIEPDEATYSLLLRVCASAAENGIVLPEHPAGNRRYDRKEYTEVRKGLPKPVRRDDLYSYANALRSKPTEEELVERDRVLDEEAENNVNNRETGLRRGSRNVFKAAGRLAALKDREEEQFDAALLQKSIGEPAGEIVKKEPIKRTSISDGIMDEEIRNKIQILETIREGKTPAIERVVPTAKSLGDQKRDFYEAIERMVAEKLSFNGKAVVSEGTNEVLKLMKESRTIDAMNQMIVNLDGVEQGWRSNAVQLYKARGGKEPVDYESELWKNALEESMKQNQGMLSELRMMAKNKVGMTALMGLSLLKQKDVIDEELVRDIRLVRESLEDLQDRGSPTRLEIAKNVDGSILKKYQLLSTFEPNAIYKRKTELVGYSIPQQTLTLDEYWQRSLDGDRTVPALKTYVVREGERFWSMLLETTHNRPSSVSLNAYLKLYTSANYLNRAKTVFQSFPTYEHVPSSYTYYTMVAMYGKNKRVHEAAEMVREMQLKGLTPSPETYGEMMIVLARTNHIEEALAALTEIKLKGLPYPKERYLRPLRMQLNKLDLADHPSLPEDKERKWRQAYKKSIRINSRRGNSRVQQAFNSV